MTGCDGGSVDMKVANGGDLLGSVTVVVTVGATSMVEFGEDNINVYIWWCCVWAMSNGCSRWWLMRQLLR